MHIVRTHPLLDLPFQRVYTQGKCRDQVRRLASKELNSVFFLLGAAHKNPGNVPSLSPDIVRIPALDVNKSPAIIQGWGCLICGQTTSTYWWIYHCMYLYMHLISCAYVYCFWG